LTNNITNEKAIMKIHSRFLSSPFRGWNTILFQWVTTIP